MFFFYFFFYHFYPFEQLLKQFLAMVCARRHTELRHCMWQITHTRVAIFEQSAMNSGVQSLGKNHWPINCFGSTEMDCLMCVPNIKRIFKRSFLNNSLKSDANENPTNYYYSYACVCVGGWGAVKSLLQCALFCYNIFCSIHRN